MNEHRAAPPTTAVAKPRVLVADDQRDVVESLRFLLKTEGFDPTTAASPDEVLERLRSEEIEAVLIDLNYARDTTSGAEGLGLLDDLLKLDPDLPVIVMTAWASVELAVEAMRRGARDFVEKPWENSRLVSILRTQVALGRAIRRGARLEAENRLLRGEADATPTLIAESAAMQPVLALIERVGPADANVLITGENGTGKSLIARVLHGVSARRSSPLVTVNIGALASSVYESELFGHDKGAFTDARQDRVGRFELADGGTLFLDEIANLGPAQQAKLLRVLETGEFERVGSSKTRRVDVRVLSATNADIAEEVRAARFRQDLLFRLNTVEIRIPSLRERRDDIPLLAEHFLRELTQRYRRDLRFGDDAMHALVAYGWPGNVRELAHVTERAVLMADGDRIQRRDLGLEGSIDDTERIEEMTLDEAEKVLIQKALARFGGNVSDAARALGLSRSAMYRRLEKHTL